MEPRAGEESQRFGQKGPGLILHGGVEGVPARGEDPAVTHGRRPVVVAREGIRAGAARLLGRSSQRTASLSCTGPALPRLSILGRRKIAGPGSRSFSKSHIRCQASWPSSVTGTDAVVSGGLR
jgi:hypothetical protein